MWLNPQETADSVILADEIFNGKLHFLCGVLIFRRIFFKLLTPGAT